MAESQLTKPLARYLAGWCLDLIFPRFCFGCARELEASEAGFVCPSCILNLNFNPGLGCILCGWRSLLGKTCVSCLRKTRIKGLISVFPYQNEIIRKLIYAFKYRIIGSIAKILGKFAFEFIKKEKLESVFDQALLVPVPLHKNRLRQRGFNQSELIAKEINFYFKTPVINDLLFRKSKTEIQAEIKDFKKRESNVANAFEINPKKDLSAYKNEKIILVDDVITSGATLESCAKVLSEAGFRKIFAFTIAKG